MATPVTSLSVFFPVYNEAEGLAALVERSLGVLDGFDGLDYELILIDDGSTDKSAAIADGLVHQYPRVQVVHHPSNQGYGAALVSGFAAASKEWLFYTDGDGQFDLADLAPFFEAAASYDAVLGYRINRQDHFGRKLNAWLWSRLVSIILGLKVRDLDCAFKLIRTSQVRRCEPFSSQGAVISAELLLKLQRSDVKWTEIGVKHYPRTTGQATGGNFLVIARAIRELVNLRLNINRRQA